MTSYEAQKILMNLRSMLSRISDYRNMAAVKQKLEGHGNK